MFTKTNIYTFFLISVFFISSINAQEAQKKTSQEKTSNGISSVQAPVPSAVKFIGQNNIYAKMQAQKDDNGNEFATLDLTAATNDPSEPDSVKLKLWRDANMTLIYSGDFQVTDNIRTRTFRMTNGAGTGKVLTSSSIGTASWQTPSGGGSGGSINGLSDGKTLFSSVYLGQFAGEDDNSTSDKANIGIGYNALGSFTNAGGGENTAIGYSSMGSFTEGLQNTAVGGKSLNGGDLVSAIGNYNTAIGYKALFKNDLGSGNVAIGFQAGRDFEGSDQLFIHNDASSTPLIWGDFFNAEIEINGHLHVQQGASKPGGGSWDNSSDIRLKDVLENYKKGLSEIKKLRTIKFRYKLDNPKGLPSDSDEYGFVAQEVKMVFPEAVYEGEDGFLVFNMHSINVAMVNAVKELSEEKKKLEKRILNLEKQNYGLEKRLTNIESSIRSRNVKTVSK